MTMLTKTANDILTMTRTFLERLKHQLEISSGDARGEREALLMDYLAKKEENLLCSFATFQEKASENAVDTWLYEYSDRHAIIHSDPREIDFTSMNASDIHQTVAEMHSQILDLYRHVYERAENHSTRALAGELVEFLESRFEVLSFESSRIEAL